MNINRFNNNKTENKNKIKNYNKENIDINNTTEIEPIIKQILFKMLKEKILAILNKQIFKKLNILMNLK